MRQFRLRVRDGKAALRYPAPGLRRGLAARERYARRGTNVHSATFNAENLQ